jgi:hypothetical protein
MLSPMLLVDIGIDTFASENQPSAETGHQWSKSARPANHSTHIASFHPFRRSFRFSPSFNSFSTLKTMFLLSLRSLKIFVYCCSVQSSERGLSGKQFPWREGACTTPPTHLHYGLEATYWFFQIFFLTAPQCGSGGPTISSLELIYILYLVSYL